MVTVIEALRTLANVRRVIFLQIMTVVELVHGDGQEYSVPSLPGIVAEVTTTYHHSPLPVFEHLKDLSQDGTNHLEEPSPCQQYSNEMYFQADLQKRLLVEADTLQPNSYFQVDGMSTGLITFIISGDRHGRTYPSASQQAKISAVNWQRHLVYRICGVLSSDLVEKLHGAAIVGVENGDVAEILETRQSATMHNARRWTIWLRRGGR
ncbi:hypothetical protein MMC24_006564 [Lignoscripta atroalba]|nr:hypothetical protein [Lignoscripta atroalba]